MTVTQDIPPLGSARRMKKGELAERMLMLRESAPETSELQNVLHELEVYQIELEMQNRELRESREALEGALERYVNLYDFAPTGYITFDEHGSINGINLTLTRILETERKWLIDRSVTSWIYPPDLQKFRSHMKRCRSEEVSVCSELRLQRRDKSLVYVELLSARCLEVGVQQQLFRTAVTDISSRKKAEEERDRFFDLSNDLLCLGGTDGYFKRVNPAWEKMSGFTREELLAHPIVNFIHPDDRANLHSRFARMQKSENSVSVETRFQRKDRSEIWLSWNIVLAGDTYYGVARDTTNEHRKNLEFENEQSWLRELIESIPIAIGLVEIETGNFLSMSSGVYELAGSLSDQLPFYEQPGFSCEDAHGNTLSGNDLPRMRAARGEELNGDPFVWRTPEKTVYLRVFSRNIPAKYDRSAMALIMFQNVSSLKEIEASLVDAVSKLQQEREIRERFVSTLTHDLRTPLTAIKMGSQLILKRPENIKSVKELGGRVLDSVDRLEQMIGDLLDANRIGAGEKIPLKLKSCDFVELSKKTLSVLGVIHGDRFVLRGPTRCMVRIDPLALRRVIENLCTNAVKYGDSEAKITISIVSDERKVILTVHNEGRPIPLEEQSSLFNPFQRSHTAMTSDRKGWGIGLTLVRGIAESHGGHAHFMTKEGLGTTFFVELPLKD